jgi:hypothetical protein
MPIFRHPRGRQQRLNILGRHNLEVGVMHDARLGDRGRPDVAACGPAMYSYFDLKKTSL